MVTRVLYTLKGTKIFNQNQEVGYEYFVRNLKNSLLYFDEVVLETGVHEVSYGEHGSFEALGPYQGYSEYKKRRESYGSSLVGKNPITLTVKVHGEEEPRPVLDTEAYSYYMSLQGELDILLENYTYNEIDFIKLTSVNSTDLKDDINRNIENIRSRLAISEYPSFINPVLDEWGFSPISAGISLKETISALTLANGFDGEIILDPFHSDILNYSLNYFNGKIVRERRQEVLSQVIQLMVPDYGSLSLNRIADLRKEPSIIEFRRVIDNISTSLDEEEDPEDVISSLFTQELIDDMDALAPSGRGKFIVNSIVDLAISLPVSPHATGIQMLVGLLKMGYDKVVEYDQMQTYNQSLSHFCTKLREEDR